jgi:hypothetical protein
MHAIGRETLQFLRRESKHCHAQACGGRPRDLARWYVACNDAGSSASERPVQLIAANTLSTAEVLSPAGEHVGKIVDFMIDTERGSVVYAVLATGGVLGVGAKMLAIPPEKLAYDSRRRSLSLGIDTAALDAAPGIDRANPPDHADQGMARERRRSHPSTSHNER